MKRTLLLIITLAVLLILCADAQAKDKWTKIQSKNFTLVGDASEKEMRKIALKLEAFRETLSLLLPNAKMTTPIPTTVFLFKSEDAFRPFKPRYKGKIRDNVGGFFLTGPQMNYIVLATGTEGINPYEVIFHEYEHFVLRNNLVHIPLWLDEGLAEFYSSFETSDDNQKIKLGQPHASHIFYLRDHPILPFKTLLEVDHKSPHYNEESKAGVFYAESWALVHYLMMGNGEKRKPQLIRFLDLVGSGASPADSFQDAFQADFKTIEEELRAYIHRMTFPILTGTFRDQFSFDKEMQTAELSEAEALYYQGDLLLGMRQIPEAQKNLEKSQTLDARFAPSLVDLGVLRMIQKQPAEGAKLFQSAIEIDPKNYLAPYYYANILAQTGAYEEAIRFYRQAIALKRDDAAVFSDLGYAYLKMHDEDDAIEAFKHGLRANPREGYFYRSLAYLYLQRRNADAAANDAANYLRISGWRDEHAQYLVLVEYFALREARNDSFATKTLQDSLAKVDATDWPYPVLRFLCHALTLPELLAQATDNDKLTEAHAYAGLELSCNGDRAGALEHLHWVKEHGNKNFVEYSLALAEITRLEQATTSRAP
jgi:tetratricopeptide (TPR) repeat protein